jgi:GDP-L-fucose synthase
VNIPENSRIYVAGHRGLVGSAILRALEKAGHTDLLTATREQLDLRDQAAVNYWFKANRPEYIFLVAGTVGGIMANFTRPAEFIYDNMMIHATVVHAAHLYKVKKLLYLGSSCIYPRDCPQPMREEYLLGSYLEPTNEPYAIAKIAGIKLCQSYRSQYGCNFISGMPTNLYGPNDNFDLISSHVLPALIRKFHLAKLAAQGAWEALQQDEALFGPIPSDLKASFGIPNDFSSQNGSSNPPSSLQDRESSISNPSSAIRPLSSGLPSSAIRPLSSGLPSSVVRPPSSNDHPVIVWGTGSARREFLHVDDLADACLFLMHRYEEPLHVNIGAGKDLTIKELAELVRDIVYPQANLAFDHSKPDGTPQKLLDIGKLHDLGWIPKIDFTNGIKNTYAWYLSQTQKTR